MATTTPGQGFPVPEATDDPNVADDVTNLAKAIEKRVMGIYGNAGVRDAAMVTVGVQEGMFAYLSDTNTVTVYDGSAWVAFPPTQPAITHGTAAPVNSDGADGDVYYRI